MQETVSRLVWSKNSKTRRDKQTRCLGANMLKYIYIYESIQTANFESGLLDKLTCNSRLSARRSPSNLKLRKALAKGGPSSLGLTGCGSKRKALRTAGVIIFIFSFYQQCFFQDFLGTRYFWPTSNCLEVLLSVEHWWPLLALTSFS